MQDVFRLVRESIPMREAARICGVEADRAGMALCPFHTTIPPACGSMTTTTTASAVTPTATRSIWRRSLPACGPTWQRNSCSKKPEPKQGISNREQVIRNKGGNL